MRATALRLGVLVCAGLFAAPAGAQYVSPVFCRPLPHAPDATGPGFWCWCPDGSYLGPIHCLRPPFPPYNGPAAPFPGQGAQGAQGGFGGSGQGGRPAFPSHPYARSPRDFFMWSEAQQDRHTRERRPVFVP
jgi:hypothetical protein